MQFCNRLTNQYVRLSKMAASDISRQIEEAEEEKRLYVKELTSLNERNERLQQKRDGGKALTDDEKADMTKWEAKAALVWYSLFPKIALRRMCIRTTLMSASML